jgi:hypothetical protein
VDEHSGVLAWIALVLGLILAADYGLIPHILAEMASSHLSPRRSAS